MRRQSLRALANPAAAPASPAITSGSAQPSRQGGWGRRGRNNLNRPAGAMLVREPSDAASSTGDTCGT